MMRATKTCGVVFAALLFLLPMTIPPSAEAKRCGAVFAGEWQAERLDVSNIGCRSAQAKLRHWFIRNDTPVLPRSKRRGWHCLRGFNGRNATPNTRACINRIRPGPPLADFQTRPYMTFELIRIEDA